MLKCRACGAVFPDGAVAYQARTAGLPMGWYGPPEGDALPCGHGDYDYCVGACRACGVDMLSSDESDVSGLCAACFAAAVKRIGQMVEAGGTAEDRAVWRYLREV